MQPLLLTTTEVAQALRQSNASVARLMASGKLESVKIGKSRRVPAASLETFIEGLRYASSPDAE